MNNAAPENTAALQEKIAELEQQLKLSDLPCGTPPARDAH